MLHHKSLPITHSSGLWIGSSAFMRERVSERGYQWMLSCLKANIIDNRCSLFFLYCNECNKPKYCRHSTYSQCAYCIFFRSLALVQSLRACVSELLITRCGTTPDDKIAGGLLSQLLFSWRYQDVLHLSSIFLYSSQTTNYNGILYFYYKPNINRV